MKRAFPEIGELSCLSFRVHHLRGKQRECVVKNLGVEAFESRGIGVQGKRVDQTPRYFGHMVDIQIAQIDHTVLDEHMGNLRPVSKGDGFIPVSRHLLESAPCLGFAGSVDFKVMNLALEF